MIPVGWNPEAFFVKASKGSFAAKAARADVYKNNCEVFRNGGYTTSSGKKVTLDPGPMLAGTIVFDSPITVPDGGPLNESVLTGVANIGSLELGRDLQLEGYNPVILNLADAYVACGWYERGSNAQEESLCRQTTLSQSLYQYYDSNKAELSGVAFKGKKYPMDIRYGAIYSPHVTVFREGSKGGFALMDEPYETAIISCAALDFNEKHGKNLDGAFRFCESLKKVCLPYNLNVLSPELFYGSGIESIEIHQNIKEIGYWAFWGCKHLKRLIIPESVTHIGYGIVSAHEGFEGIECHAKGYHVENDALIDDERQELLCCWTRQKNYVVPECVKRIADISGNEFLEAITVKQPIELSTYDVFASDINLRYVDFQGGATGIYESTFWNCPKLENK